MSLVWQSPNTRGIPTPVCALARNDRNFNDIDFLCGGSVCQWWEIYSLKFMVYNPGILLYDKGEQSRKPRVKCRQNGELFGRRRASPAMGYPHPLQQMNANISPRAMGNVIKSMSLRTSDRCHWCGNLLLFGGFPRQCAHWLGMTGFLDCHRCGGFLFPEAMI